MARFWKKWYGKLCIILVSLSVLSVLLFFIFFPQLYVNKLKRDLNNEIVSEDFPNWRQVQVDENINIYLPNEWTLYITEDNVQIVDDSGLLIGSGVKRGIPYEKNINVYLGEYYGCNVVSSQYEILGWGRYGNSAKAYFSSCQLGNGSEHEQLLLELPYYIDYEYLIFFSTDYSAEVEAIAWSMELVD